MGDENSDFLNERTHVSGAQKPLLNVMISSYIVNLKKVMVIVAVNYSFDVKPFNLKIEGVNVPFFISYITSDKRGDDLRPLNQVSSAEKLTIPARTIITYIGKIK